MKDIALNVLLVGLFFLVLIPVSLLRRLLGDKFLILAPNKAQQSYWNYRETKRIVTISRVNKSLPRYFSIQVLKILFKSVLGSAPYKVKRELDKLPEDMYTI